MAIYQGNTKISGAGIAIDSSLSDSSTNPVQNQAVTNALEDVGYDTWQKPADWIDIRSGALPNSVYFLVGHSADYATYPTFVVKAGVSNSGTYDVFVDGIKQATTASGTETTLNWQTLALTSGYDVTYPAALKTHVVRVTPTLESDTLASIRTDYSVVKGVMWAHFTLTNAISLLTFLSNYGNLYEDRAPLFEALTTPTNEIKVTDLAGAFNFIKNIKTLPVFVGKGNAYASRVGTNNAFTRSGIKQLHFKDFWIGEPFALFRGCTELKSIELENSRLSSESYIFENCYKLKRLPDPWFVGSLDTNAITNAAALEPTVLDLSQKTTYQRLNVMGSSTYPMKGLKGITVSNEAPFNSTTSPQINVSYTGLDRNALVNLFKSMPYNVGYTVVGSPTITDGVASGFSENNYLQFWNANFPLTSMKTYEASVKFTTENTMSVNQGIIGSLNYGSSSFGLRCSFYNRITSVFRYKKSSDGTIANVEIQIPYFLAQANTTYYGKMSWNLLTGAYYIGVSTDNISFYEISGTLEDYDSPQERNWLLGIGKVQDDQYFRGSIDLNNTYIKVNGVPWFTGKAAMTKTCNIKGCTGTTDLTQQDKNIALDKGWELTVA